MNVFAPKDRPTMAVSREDPRETPWPHVPKSGFVLAFGALVALKLALLVWVVFGLAPSLGEALAG